MGAERFGDWLPLDRIEAVVGAGPGVCQVRVRIGLVDYPRGRSAMVWYGAASGIGAALREFRAAGLGRLGLAEAEVWARWMPHPVPGRKAQAYLERFRDRFGSLPRGNGTGREQAVGKGGLTGRGDGRAEAGR